MKFSQIVSLGAIAAVAQAGNGSNNSTTTTYVAGAVQQVNGATFGAGLAAVGIAALLF